MIKSLWHCCAIRSSHEHHQLSYVWGFSSMRSHSLLVCCCCCCCFPFILLIQFYFRFLATFLFIPGLSFIHGIVLRLYRREYINLLEMCHTIFVSHLKTKRNNTNEIRQSNRLPPKMLNMRSIINVEHAFASKVNKYIFSIEIMNQIEPVKNTQSTTISSKFHLFH